MTTQQQSDQRRLRVSSFRRKPRQGAASFQVVPQDANRIVEFVTKVAVMPCRSYVISDFAEENLPRLENQVGMPCSGSHPNNLCLDPSVGNQVAMHAAVQSAMPLPPRNLAPSEARVPIQRMASPLAVFSGMQRGPKYQAPACEQFGSRVNSRTTRYRRSLRGGLASRGFTLVELMIGTLLIGLLLAIALPSYSRYRDRVRTKACMQDIIVLSGLVQLYLAANGTYPNSLAELGNDGKTDPWGRPYVYYNIDANGKGQARKDHALNPLNTDFDLYSPGPDGKTKPQITQQDSVDDILRASNGQFIGVAADF